MTLKRMRDMIRVDCRIKGISTMVGLIDHHINQSLRDVTSLAKYMEFLVVDANIATVAADNPTFLLPTDIQHLEDRSIRYSTTNSADSFEYLAKFNANIAKGLSTGTPQYYYRQAGNLVLYPKSTLAGSGIFLTYYRYPTTLLNDTDVFPLPQMEKTVMHDVVAIMARATNTKLATLANRDKRDAYSAGRASQQ